MYLSRQQHLGTATQQQATNTTKSRHFRLRYVTHLFHLKNHCAAAKSNGTSQGHVVGTSATAIEATHSGIDICLSCYILQTHKKWFQTTLDPLLPTPHPHPPWEEEHGGSEKRLWAPAIFARKNSGRSRCCSSDVGNARNPLHPSTQCHFGDYQPGISEFLTWDILHIITPPLIQNCGDSLEAFTLPNPKLSPLTPPKIKQDLLPLYFK